MREALVILLVIAIILVLTAVRYRKQIAAAIRIWQSLKSMKQQMSKQMNQRRGESDQEIDGATGPLVNCAKCGTWVPEQRAIKLRGGMTYCSAACLEKTGSAR